MVKGSKSIKKQIDKNVMIMDRSNCMALVRIENDNIHPDYKFNFKNKTKTELDFNELRLTADSKNIYFKNTKFSFEFINKFLKLVRVFYDNNKIQFEDLQYYEYDIELHPCLIVYDTFGCIIAPLNED